MASGKFEIVEYEYDYSDDENTDKNEDIDFVGKVAYEPKIKFFGFYTKS